VRDYLAECLASTYEELRRSSLAGKIWVVDNGSTDGTLELLEDLFPSTTVLANGQNVGFGAANNQGMRAALADNPRYFLLLNPDTVVRPGAIAALADCLDARPQAGMAGGRLVYGDGRFQHSAFAFPGVMQAVFDLWPMPQRLYNSRVNGRYARSSYQPDGAPFRVDIILGAAMLVRRDVAETTGGFDEAFHMYCEEIDWCRRVRSAGWEIFVVPAAEIVHYAGSSTSQAPARSLVELWASRQRLYKRHHGPLRMGLARRLVNAGLQRKARQTSDPAMQRAYRAAASFWYPQAGEQQPDAVPGP
jgi:GT2 family glycosyltransferase